jgi:uncharacterized protein YlzI (FlbEa/FlbD family)
MILVHSQVNKEPEVDLWINEKNIESVAPYDQPPYRTAITLISGKAIAAVETVATVLNLIRGSE